MLDDVCAQDNVEWSRKIFGETVVKVSLNKFVKTIFDEIMALNVNTHDNMTKCAHTLTKRAIRTSNIKDMAMRFFAELTKQDPV